MSVAGAPAWRWLPAEGLQVSCVSRSVGKRRVKRYYHTLASGYRHDLGEIVGYSFLPGSTGYRAFCWKDWNGNFSHSGEMVSIGTPGGMTGAARAEKVQVSGYAFRWLAGAAPSAKPDLNDPASAHSSSGTPSTSAAPG
jgi:hypothetical protein